MIRSQSGENSNLPIIDFVRTISILLVVFFHYLGCVMGQTNHPVTLLSSPEWPSEFWIHLSRNGVYGVLSFFFVSGFLITRIISRISGNLFQPDLRQFYIRRIARIFPLYYFLVSFGAVIFYFYPIRDLDFEIFFKRPNWSYDLSFWGSILTFTTNWFFLAYAGTYRLIGIFWFVLWSLSVEEQFYFFYPLILRVIKTKRNMYAFLIAAIITGPIVRYYDSIHNPQYGPINIFSTFGIFDAIAFGALLFLVSEDVKIFLENHRVICWLFCLLGFGAFGAVYWGTFYQGHPDEVLIPSALSLSLFIFLLGGLNLNVFRSKIFSLFCIPGKYSYGIYLFHETVLFFIKPFMKRENAASLFFVFVGILVFIGHLSYRLFETPMNRSIRELLKTPSGIEQRVVKFLFVPAVGVVKLVSSIFFYSVKIIKKQLANFLNLSLGYQIALIGFAFAVVGVTVGFWGLKVVVLERAVILGIGISLLGSLTCLAALLGQRFFKK